MCQHYSHSIILTCPLNWSTHAIQQYTSCMSSHTYVHIVYICIADILLFLALLTIEIHMTFKVSQHGCNTIGSRTLILNCRMNIMVICSNQIECTVLAKSFDNFHFFLFFSILLSLAMPMWNILQSHDSSWCFTLDRDKNDILPLILFFS